MLAGVGSTEEDRVAADEPFVIVLGVAQDGGYPQAGCSKPCCAAAWEDAARARSVSCIAVVDPATSQRWMFDATPDFRAQLRRLDAVEPDERMPGLDGIFLTHAHIGHYTGLLHLGHEVIGAEAVPVWVMPRMRQFLETHGPWEQLVTMGNIVLHDLADGEPVQLNDRITVTPIRVPHREEYSEVVGFRIEGPARSVLFIPDIDKWTRWETPVEAVVATVDVAYLDGTFHDQDELPHRDMSEIPHPFVVESIMRFADEPAGERAKVRFIHLNHSNPALDPGSEARRAIERAGMRVAEEGERVGLGATKGEQS